MLTLTGKFDNYECDVGKKPRVWYLELKKLSKQIQKAGGSRTDADMAAVIIAHAPEEYAVDTKLARNEVKERTKNNKDYLQTVLDIYQNGYKDVKKVTKKDEQDVSFYAQQGGGFKVEENLEDIQTAVEC